MTRIATLGFLLSLVGGFCPATTFAVFDVVPYNDGGTIVTGGHDDFEPDPLLANNEFQRVFGYEFGGVPVAPYVMSDPGFNNGTGFSLGYGTNNGALLPSVAASFTLTSNLQYWNGVGTVSFGAAPALVSLGIKNSTTMAEIRVNSSGATGTIPIIQTATAAGRIHAHVVSSLYYNDESSPNVLPNAPDGIYALGLSITQPGLLASEPIYFVYLNNVGGNLGGFQTAADIHNEAIDWVQTHWVDSLRGDFNGDGVYTCVDVNSLVASIAAQSNAAAFDLTGDNLVNVADLDMWRAVAGSVLTVSGRAILPGDANLDGTVDGSDFGAWNSHKFTAVAAWCSGDFNADGFVDGGDFGIWNSNKFQSSDAFSLVPEPSSLPCLILAVWLLSFGRNTMRVRRLTLGLLGTHSRCSLREQSLASKTTPFDDSGVCHPYIAY